MMKFVMTCEYIHISDLFGSGKYEILQCTSNSIVTNQIRYIIFGSVFYETNCRIKPGFYSSMLILTM